jgi:DedD protein
MDRALLERMIGAVVLVLLLVVVAPALLDGRNDTGSDNAQSISASGGTRTEVIVLNAPRQAEASAPAVESVAVAQEPRRKIKTSPAPPPVVKQPQRASGFVVQVGSFGEQVNAQQFAAQLQANGYAVFVQRSGKVHRVYAGPRPSRAAAEKLAAVLQDDGYKGMVTELGSAR